MVIEVENLIFNIKRRGDIGAGSMNRLSASLKNLGKASNQSSGLLAKVSRALGRIAMYRVLRTIIKSITDAFTEGLKNVYQFSKTIDSEIARSLDAISGASLQMKNQLGAALGELLATVQPIVEAIINLITRLADIMSQVFAVLGGRSTYHKATQSTNEWAKAAGGAAAAAKEWKNQLMGFDEINRLNEPSDGGGGGGGGASDFGNWELAPVEIDLSWLDKYKEATAEWLQSLDFEPLTKAWGKLKEAVLDFLGVIDRGLYWAYANILLPLAKWVIEDAAPASIELLASMLSFLTSVLEKVGPAFADLWNSYMKPVAEWIGDKFVTVLHWLRDAFDGLAEKIRNADSFGEFLKSLDGKEQVILSIAGAIATVVLAFAGFSLVSKIVSGFGFVLGLLSNPIALAILGIAALIYAGIELYQHWDEIKQWWSDTVVPKFQEGADKLKNIWEGIKTKFDEVIAPIKQKIEEWKQAWNEHVKKNLEKSEELRRKFAELKNDIEGKINNIKEFFSNLKLKWDEIVEGVSAKIEGLKVKFDNLKQFVQEKIDAIKEFFTGLKQKFHEIIENVKEKIDDIKSKFDEWRDKTSDVTGAIEGFFSGVETFIGGVVGGIVSTIDSITSACQRAIAWLRSLGRQRGGTTVNVSGYSGRTGRFATGGFPEDGLFFANSNELVGQFSDGRTAVANNQEIIAGISRGVYDAVFSAIVQAGGSGSNNSGPIILNINGREFARATYADQQAVAREHGSRIVVNG